MAKANVTLAISGTYNGRALEQARKDLEKFNINAAAAAGGISGAFVNAGGSIAELGGKIHNAGYKMESMGKGLTASVTAPLGALGAVAIKSFSDVEKGTNAVIKATGATGEQAERLERAYRDAAVNVVGSFEDIGSAAGELNTRLGLTDSELTAATEQTAKYAKVTGQDAATAVQDVTRLMNNAGIEASDYSKVLDWLTVAGQASGIEVSKLASSVNDNAASLKEMGFSTEASIALLANFEKEGANTSNILAAMKKGVANWAKEGKNADEEFAKFVDGVNDGSVSLADAIDIFGARSGAAMYDAAQKGQLNFQEMFNNIANSSEGALDTVYENTLTSQEKLEIATKKIQNRLADTGAVLVDKFVPIIERVCDAVDDAVGWFNNLDDGAKDMAINFGLVAAAAGPVLTIGGKLTKGLGNIVTGFGKVIQKVGVFGAKMKYGTDSMGKLNVATDKTVTKTSKLTTAAKGATDKTAALGSTAQTTSANMGKAATNTDKATKSMNTAKGAASGLKGALSGIGGALAITAIIAGVGMIVDHFQKAKEEADKFDKATNGLRSSLGEYQTAIANTSSAMNDSQGANADYINSLGDVHARVKDMIESNAELADSIGGIMKDAGARVAELDTYRDSIEKFAGKALTSKDDIAEFELAIQNLNDATGRNFQIVKENDGTYQIYEDGVRKAKDEVLKFIDAQKDQIQIEANHEAWVQAYKDIGEKAKTATDATKKYNDLLAKQKDYQDKAASSGDDYTAELTEVDTALKDAKKDMDDANDSYKAAADLTDQLREKEILLQQAMQEGNGFEAFIANNELLMATLQTTNQSCLNFKNDLQDLGLSEEDLRTIGEENLPLLAQIYDGSVTSITGKLEEFGIKLDDEKLKSKETAEAMEGHINSFSATTKTKLGEAGIDIATLCNKLADAGVSSSDFNTITDEQLGKVAETYDGDLDKCVQDLKDFTDANKTEGKESGKGLLENMQGAMRDRKKDVKQVSRTVSLESGAELGSANTYSTGSNWMQGFVNGLKGVPVLGTVASIASSVIKKFQNVLGIHSPSTIAEGMGINWDLGLLGGMKKSEGLIAKEAQQIEDAMEISPRAYDLTVLSGVPAAQAASSQLPPPAPTSRGNIEINLTVNVNSQNQADAAAYGQTLGEQLYQEFIRHERAAA